MELGVLGPLRVADDGREVQLRSQKQRALLAFLVLHAGEVVSTDRLLDELWGERPPPTARNALQNYVSQLRKTLGADVLRTRPPGYVLDVEPDAVDAVRFVRLLEGARGASAEQRAALLREALALWRGRALADLEFEPFALREAPRLDELRAAAEEELVAAELELGRHAEVVPRLEELVAANPLRERLHGQLMLALYRSGRQGEALAAYRTARRRLVEELGIEPGPSLRALEAAILRQDPALDAPVVETPSAVDLRERRATATVLYAELDVEAELDPERHRALTARALHELRAATEYHGGTVERLAGDELVAVFGVPARHEDDPLRAVRAALQISRSAKVPARIALDTGEVIGPAAGSRSPVVGAPLSAAKRLAEAAPPGIVVATAATHTLVEAAVDAEALKPLKVRGQPAAVTPVRIDSVVEERATRVVADTPLVGRGAELAALRAAYAGAVAENRSRVFGVFGEAGFGKTRLARELARGLAGEAEILVGRCVSYGEGATWLPLREIVGATESALAGALAETVDATRAARILESIVGAGGAEVSVQDIFWAARRFLEGRALRRPVLVVVDDVHWAEPTFLDFIEHLASTPPQGPILLLVLARPELAEERPELRSLDLGPLADDEVRTLVDAAAVDAVPEDLRERIRRLAEGNPLFAEQLVAFVQEHGAEALRSVPPTVEALLSARLDRLDEETRAVLQRAAVVGRDFWQAAVLHLTPELEVPAVGRHLEQLAQKGLIHRATTSGGREQVFRFHHVLIRDVAYGAIPKSERSELHERVAEWLDAARDAEDELVGYHLEQAYRCRVDVGTVDRHARSLATDAGERLGSAGIQAAKRADSHAASNLLGRANTLLSSQSRARLDLRIEAAIAERAVGRVARAVEMLLEVVGAAADRDPRVEMRARIELANIQHHTDARGDDLLELAALAIPIFEREDDNRSLARTWLLIGDRQGGMHGQMAAWADAAERAKSYYERAGWPPSICRPKIAAALYHGPVPAPHGIRRCRALLEETGTDRFSEAGVHVFLAGLLGMRGKYGPARQLLSEARATYQELRTAESLARVTDWMAADVEALAGRHDVAETLLRGVCERYDALGEHSQFATAAGDLAESLYAQDRPDEARDLCEQAAERAAPDDVGAAIRWRSVAAKIAARDGSIEQAEVFARGAVELAAPTDGLNRHGAALLAFAEVARLDERPTDSARLAERALELFARKGNTVAARKARRLIQLAPL